MISPSYAIMLERLNGAHNLRLGDYYLDTTSNVLYVGIGTFGQGGVTPVGTITITENGTYNVSLYEYAFVNVDSGVSGTEIITANGIYDIATKAFVDVQVPQPEGSLTITENGTYDVADKVNAVVQVESPDPISLEIALYPALPFNVTLDVTLNIDVIS